MAVATQVQLDHALGHQRLGALVFCLDARGTFGGGRGLFAFELCTRAAQRGDRGQVARAQQGRPWSSDAPLRGVFTARPADLVVDGRLVATLPAMALAVVQAAILARVTRSAVLEVMREDYVRTARA